MRYDPDDPKLYFNRELSWLRFNSRVLYQATDASLPPLERLKFLAIYGTNLDEFYMIRVAGLKRLVKARIFESGSDKLPPLKQLELIRAYLHKEQLTLEKSYKQIKERLGEVGVFIAPYQKLDESQQAHIKKIFYNEIFSVIIPIAVDATHPFPHLNNLSFGLALTLKDDEGNIKHALIRIPRILPRFIKLDSTFVPIESVVEHFAADLFAGLTPVVATPFRVTRNADIEIEEEEADDFLELMQEGVRSRNRGQLVRLELVKGADSSLIEFLLSHLKLDKEDIYIYKKVPLNLGAFWQIVSDKALSHLLLPPFSPRLTPPVDTTDIYDAMSKEDILLYHPFESFDPVVNFIKEAASDEDTIVIRMTLYRVGKRSPIVKALIDAAKDGKQVMVMVELKARFDEENNLKWAKALEEAGAHVVYGIPGLKVHAKIAQVIKRKEGHLKSYVHLATGNYNPTTAKIYTDFSYFTVKETINKDATHFFHILTGYSAFAKLDTLFMSPTQIKPKLLALIKHEASYGSKGRIILKANSLVDADIIKALYKASQKGCKIDLIIRGICCLRPGVEGVSEKIKVHSIIGKYLEHPRVFYFAHDEVQCYISSADLMPRNLMRRIELMTPIEDEKLKEKILYMLKLQLNDNVRRWILLSNGEYKKVETVGKKIDNHALLEAYVKRIADKSKKDTPEYIKRIAKQILKESK